jgi:hypothetical protein
MPIILDEPAKTYHDNPATGSSDARNFLISPQLYRDGMDGLCDRDPSAALLFGTAAHMALLEPARFLAGYKVKPEDMSFATTEGKAWKKEAVTGGFDIISFDDHRHLKHMHARMPVEVRAVFDACIKESTVRSKIGALDVQCRPDLWNRKGRRFYDVKTILDASHAKIEAAIHDRGYHIQLAWYERVIEAELGERHESRLIFVEKAAPYRWREIDIDPEFRAMGRAAVDLALEGIAARMKSGDWSDDGDVYDIASPPRWARDTTDELVEA